MKYIDAERLRKEVKMAEEAAHKSALGCADSEERKFHKGRDFAYQYVGFLIDSLQQEQPIGEEYAIEIGKHTHILHVGSQSDIDNLIRQEKQEQPEVDLEKEIEWEWVHREKQEVDLIECAEMDKEAFVAFARHFYELGKLSNKK